MAALDVPFIRKLHAFIDGNGRVGRLLFPLMFVAEEEAPIHLATFLKLRQREYYDALLDVQMRLRWDKWPCAPPCHGLAID